jgi:hypothetical protein
MQPPKSFLFTMEDYVRDSFRGKEVIVLCDSANKAPLTEKTIA